MADTGAKLTPGLVGLPPAARPGIWAAFWGWLHSPRQRLLIKRAIAAWGTLFSFAFLRLPVVVAAVWVGVLLLTSLTERTTSIEPISVPKALADRGYTPEVAAYRLRDALNQFAGDALNRPRVMTHSFNMLGFADQQMEAAKIALQTEAPSIVVPTTGLSLDAIATSIRVFFGSERRRTISGEFAIKKDLLWLRLRLDGRELYSSAEGADAESPDELFAKAVPTIFERIQPYVVASAEKDPEKALKIADAFIARLPDSNENVAWLYTLKGNIYRDSGRLAEATDSLKKASVLSPRLTMPYLLSGLVLSDQGNYDGAIAEYAKAMHLDRNNVNAFNLRGTAYRDRKEYDWAIADYTEAIRLAPKDYDSLNNRGTAYALTSEYDRAIADFTEAIRLDPSRLDAFIFRGIAYRDRKEYDQAIADFTEAIRVDSNYPDAYTYRGNAYFNKEEYGPAIADYSEAIRHGEAIGFKNAYAYTRRGHAYLNKEEYGPAIADYSEAIRLDPKDADALERGFANYVAGNYGAAASDLGQSTQTTQKTPKYAYSALWLYLARSRSGSDNAGAELVTNSAILKQSDWPFPVVELFLGRRTPEATLAASEKPDERCEAQFYIGEWRLLRADYSAAREALQAAADTCPESFYEFACARAELKRLGN